MGCRILYDSEQNYAALYCSTTDVAFGPLFPSWDGRDADERAESFLRWLDSPACPYATFEQHPAIFSGGRRDARMLTDEGLLSAYAAWLAQEADQGTREARESEVPS